MSTPTSSPLQATRSGSGNTEPIPVEQKASCDHLAGAPLSFAADSHWLNGGANFLKSKFVLALALFFIIDGLVRFNFHPDRFALPEHGYIWWAVKGFKELDRTPDIVIFGSSLMLSVTNDGDAVYLQQPIDGAVHHRSVCLEDGLSRQFHLPLSSYSFAVGGQMASDAYAIERTLIDSAHRPKLIIWGIAPRDLVDAAFDGPPSSDTAHYMNKIAQSPVIPSAHRSLPWFIERALTNVSAIFRMRLDIVSLVQDRLRQLRSAIQSTSAQTLFKKTLALGREAAPNLEIGDWVTPVCACYSESIKDNTSEYRKRYNPFKVKSFQQQLFYLEKFLLMNRDLGIRVVLVNMPLTPDNMRLMPQGLYGTYFSALKDVASKYNAQILDFNTGSYFSRTEFFDTAHLNGLGAERLARLVCKRIAGQI